MDDVYDVIVIGLGAMGSASLYQLSKSEIKVLGIDQFSPPHNKGSSFGDTRITRLAVGEGAEYVPFVLRSHEIWKELEEKSGKRILHEVGNAIFANEYGNQHGSENFIAQTEKFAKQFKIEHELMDNVQLSKHFPLFNFENGETGYFEKHGGYVLPEVAIKTQLDLAKENNAEIITNTKVLSLNSEDNAVVVRTSNAEYRAKKVITTAGAWVNDFLPSSHQVFKVERQVLYWFDMKTDHDQFRDIPTFVWLHGDKDTDQIYGFPAIDGERGGLKLATEQHSVTTTPDNFETSVSKEEEAEMFKTHVQKQIPALSNKVIKSVACKYTVTPDYGFVIDKHPEDPNIIIASPCSGHGFKHSAAIGETLAQLATRDKTKINITSFRLDRF